jgi:hypothetical protein
MICVPPVAEKDCPCGLEGDFAGADRATYAALQLVRLLRLTPWLRSMFERRGVVATEAYRTPIIVVVLRCHIWRAYRLSRPTLGANGNSPSGSDKPRQQISGELNVNRNPLEMSSMEIYAFLETLEEEAEGHEGREAR